MTLSESVENYLTEKKALFLLSESSLNVRSCELKRFIRFCNGQGIKYPRQIKKNNIIGYLSSINVSKQTQANIYFTLLSFFDFLAVNGIISEDNFFGIKQPKFGYSESDYLEFDEVKKLFKTVLEAGSKRVNPRNILLLNLFFTLCLRVGETVNLKLSDIKLDIKQLWILRKGGDLTKLPLNDELVNNFLTWYDSRKTFPNSNSEYVFLSTRGSKLTERQVAYTVRNSLILAGIKKRKSGPHLLRHSGATFRLKNGENIKIIQKMLGHKNMSTTEKYLHFNEDDIKSLVDNSPKMLE